MKDYFKSTVDGLRLLATGFALLLAICTPFLAQDTEIDANIATVILTALTFVALAYLALPKLLKEKLKGLFLKKNKNQAYSETENSIETINQLNSENFSNVEVETPVMKKELSEIDKIDQMSPLEFSNYLAKLLTTIGYSDVRLISNSRNQDVNISATKNDRHFLLYGRLSAEVINEAIVQELYDAAYSQDVTLVIVTNNNFSMGAKELSFDKTILLWDRDNLVELIA